MRKISSGSNHGPPGKMFRRAAVSVLLFALAFAYFLWSSMTRLCSSSQTANNDALLRQKLRRLVRNRSFRATRSVALYGAGQHTRRLLALDIIPRDRICAVFDDNPSIKSIENIPVCPVSKAPDMSFDMLIVSSDTYEKQMLDRAKSWLPTERKVLAIYNAQTPSVKAELSTKLQGSQ